MTETTDQFLARMLLATRNQDQVVSRDADRLEHLARTGEDRQPLGDGPLADPSRMPAGGGQV
jgi:hypothetical protein